MNSCLFQLDAGDTRRNISIKSGGICFELDGDRDIRTAFLWNCYRAVFLEFIKKSANTKSVDRP